MKLYNGVHSVSRGFSLMEIMIVLGLTSVILLTVSSLFSQTTKTLKFLKEKSRTLESASLGCERLASELREAVEVENPIPLGRIRFKKVKPSENTLLGLPLLNEEQRDALGPPNTWGNEDREYTGTQLAAIEYEVDDDSKLLRTAAGSTALVAREVNLFQVEPLGGVYGIYKIRLSLQEQRRVVVFESIVTCPALQGRSGP